MVVNVAIIQFDIYKRDLKKNRAKIGSMVAEAMNDNPDIILLPETWATGFSGDIFQEASCLAQDEEGSNMRFIKELASSYGVYFVAGTILEKTSSGLFNTIFLINTKGETVGRYQKMHLFSLENEHVYMNSGKEIPIFQAEWGLFGLMTCYDIRFLELSRILALKGAEVLFVVANFNTDLEHWRTLLRARAIENQLYVVACNRVGSIHPDKKRYFGHSLIIHPWGEILREAGEGEEVLTCSFDCNEVSKVRKKNSMFQDRQPRCYGDILNDF